MLDWKNLLWRKTNEGHYFAFVDGLRFLAIASVVFFHIPILKAASEGESTLLQMVIPPFHITGGRGVHIFFVLSAFILGVNEGKRSVSLPLATFYKRRWWRIYPPFFLAMGIVFVGNVWVTHQHTFGGLFPSFLATATYTQNFFSYYCSLPELSAVTWTLELEIQFYLLFPFLKQVYTLSAVVRRALLIMGTLAFILLPYFFPLPFTSLYDNFPLFLLGMLMADLYVNEKYTIPSFLHLPLALVSFVYLFYSNPDNNHSLLFEMAFVVSLSVLFYVAYQKGAFNKILSCSMICIVGGMCYSIYLIHTPLLSLLEKLRRKMFASDMSGIDVAVWCVLNVSVVLVFSMAYFLLVEKPFMGRKKGV